MRAASKRRKSIICTCGREGKRIKKFILILKYKIFFYLFLKKKSDKGDYLATVEYNPENKKYGKVIARTRLPNIPGKIKKTLNEPHHLGISGDGRWIVAGGLFSFKIFFTSILKKYIGLGSFLNGPYDEIFVFRVDEITKSKTKKKLDQHNLTNKNFKKNLTLLIL